MTKKIILFIVSIALLTFACVETFDPGLITKQRKLVVDGGVTDKLEYINIQLSFSAGYNNKDGVFDQYVSFAKVNVKDDKGKTITFVEDNAKTGLYTSEEPFKGEVGRSYTLEIDYQGRKYRSKPELMLPVPPIKTVKTVYEKNTDPNPPAIGDFKVYIDVDDPASQTNFYKWSYKHFRRINICKLKRPPGAGEALVPFDQYPCCEPCWQLQICPGCINLASDQYVNGKTLANQYVGSVPYASLKPYFMLIEQRSLSKEAFVFWKTVKEQISNSGGIFDVPPTFIKGNISNIADPEELVLGYFGASAVSQKPIYLQRYVPGQDPFNVVNGLRLGPIIEECEVCKESSLRTQIRPLGWDDAYGLMEYWEK